MTNPFSLKGRGLIITGASSGIGRECAIRCSNMGADVILIARDKDRLEKTLSMMQQGNHHILPIDLRQVDQIENELSHYKEISGNFTGLVHAAGIEKTKPFHLIKTAEYIELYTVNVLAGFELARILSRKPYFHPELATSFVFISSVMGEVGQKGKTAYCSTKGALQAGCKAMALELAEKRIRINTILPGLTETEMTVKLFDSLPADSRQAVLDLHPLGFGKPEDVANAAIFLLSDAAKWITGTELVVDGGYLAQ